MTSETWVWIHLPHELTPTLCGVHRHDGHAGRFVYGRTYLANPKAVAIDPIALPLQAKEYVTTHLQGWFSVLRDSGPDAWGKRLIDRNLGPQDQCGYLINAFGEPVGALTFSASRDVAPVSVTAPSVRTLEHVLQLHARVEAGEQLTAAESRELLGQAGTGGARPKSTIDDGGKLYLCKGVSINDKADYAPVPIVEAALLSLASELDIQAPEPRIIVIDGQPVLMVPRFDREAVPGGFARWRYASGQTLFWSAPGVAQWSHQGSYNNLARHLAKWEKTPTEDIRELYRRIVFNALVGNLDDHEKNHGLIASADGNFRLTPVFDLSIVATAGAGQALAMVFGQQGATITLDNLLSDCSDFGYSAQEALEVVHGQWEHIEQHALARLVHFGCDEARAARTLELMPGHRLLDGMTHGPVGTRPARPRGG